MSILIPQFARGSALCEDAFRFAHGAYAGSDAGLGELAHPIQVAELLAARGCDDDVLAAALLHDLVEDTETEVEDLEDRFGDRVADLVDVLTEDESIELYARRKAEHRRRVARAGRRAAAIYAADKVAKLREAGDGAAAESRPEQLDHYAATLQELRMAHPGPPFLPELERELARLPEPPR